MAGAPVARHYEHPDLPTSLNKGTVLKLFSKIPGMTYKVYSLLRRCWKVWEKPHLTVTESQSKSLERPEPAIKSLRPNCPKNPKPRKPLNSKP